MAARTARVRLRTCVRFFFSCVVHYLSTTTDVKECFSRVLKTGHLGSSDGFRGYAMNDPSNESRSRRQRRSPRHHAESVDVDEGIQYVQRTERAQSRDQAHEQREAIHTHTHLYTPSWLTSPHDCCRQHRPHVLRSAPRVVLKHANNERHPPTHTHLYTP